MSDTIKDRLLADIKAAMKQRDQEQVLALRLLHSEIKNLEIAKREELTPEELLGIVQKAVKKGADSIDQFRKGGREDLVEKEQAQVDLFKRYLPRQMGRPELETLVDKVIEEVGAEGKKDMGRVMSAVMAEVKGRADGKLVSSVVGQKLS